MNQSLTPDCAWWLEDAEAGGFLQANASLGYIIRSDPAYPTKGDPISKVKWNENISSIVQRNIYQNNTCVLK